MLNLVVQKADKAQEFWVTTAYRKTQRRVWSVYLLSGPMTWWWLREFAGYSSNPAQDWLLWWSLGDLCPAVTSFGWNVEILVPPSPFLFRSIRKSGILHSLVYRWYTTYSNEALCLLLADTLVPVFRHCLDKHGIVGYIVILHQVRLCDPLSVYNTYFNKCIITKLVIIVLCSIGNKHCLC